MIDGRKIAMENGGLRKSNLWKIARDYVLSFQSGQTWSRKIGETTARKYFIEMYRVCDELGLNPDQLLETKFKAMKEANTPLEARLCENMLEKFLYAMREEGQSPLMTKNALISFFKNNDYPLMPSFASEIEQREKAPEEYRVIERADEVVEIEKYLNYERDIAVLWFLESTGIRRGSLKYLRFGHLYEIRHVGNETRFYNWFEEDKEGELDRLVPLMLDIPAEYLKGKGRGRYKGTRQVTFVHFG